MVNSKNTFNFKNNKDTSNKSISLRPQVDGIRKREKIFKIENKIVVQEKKVKAINDIEVNPKLNTSSIDDSKRLFLKLAGVAGLGLAASTLFPKGADAYVAGSTPTSNVVGLKNASNTRINPATEETLVQVKDVVESNYALILDDTSTANVTYIGTAVPGSITSGAVWRIKKIDQTTGTVITWADGDTSFNNIWDNRVSLTYL